MSAYVEFFVFCFHAGFVLCRAFIISASLLAHFLESMRTNKPTGLNSKMKTKSKQREEKFLAVGGWSVMPEF
jgi:hypothetical protein